MKTILRIICMAMLAVMLISCFVSCAKAGDDAENEDAVSTEGGAEENGDGIRYDANGYELDDLPDDLNYGGKDVNILMWKEWAKQDFMLSEEITWSKELYERQVCVEERLNVTIKIDADTSGSWNYRKDFISKVDTDLQSNEVSSYDIIGSYGASIGGIATKSLATNLYDVEYLNFKKPWWKNDQIDNATINGKVYFVTGDITPTSTLTMHCVYGNEDLLTNYGHKDLYDLVYSGKWTVEKMKEVALENTVYDKDDPKALLGLTICASAQGPLLHASGVKYLEHDNKGLLKISDALSDQKVHSLFATLQGLYNQYDNVETQTNNSKFANGKAFFHLGAVGDMVSFAKSSKFSFVVLPLPKYDEDQKQYHTTNGAWNTYYSIPIKTADRAMSGAVLEALASQAYRTLTPVVFEESFSTKFVSDPEDAAMVQYIYDALTYDCAHVYADDAVGTLHAAFNDVLSSTASWSSIYGGHIESWTNKIMILNNNLK